MSAFMLMPLCTAICFADGSIPTQQAASPVFSLSAGAAVHQQSQLGSEGLVAYLPAVLRIEGDISWEGTDHAMLDLATLQTLTPYRISTSTVVTDGVLDFDGVLLRDVFDYVGARGNKVTATALNGYQVEIPMQDFLDFDVILAWAVDDQPLKADDKGPFWIIYPRDQHDVLQDIRYDYRWVWQLSALRVH